MELIDSFYKPYVFDAYTFVFDERDEASGYYTMLGMSEDGRSFCQWTQGLYDPDGDNEHLGQRVDFHTLGVTVLGYLMDRLSIITVAQRREEA